MKLTSKGQVTIPQDIRQRLGLHPGEEVDFVVDGDAVKIVLAHTEKTRGERIVEQMLGRATVKMTTDEIMALTRGEDWGKE